MRNPINRLYKKWRKYPIIHDKQGKTIHDICMECFDKKLRPGQVIRQYGFNRNTVLAYWASWKRVSANFSSLYPYFRITERKYPGFMEKSLIAVVDQLGITDEEILNKLSEPLGFHKFVERYFVCDNKSKSTNRVDRILEEIMTAILLGEFVENSPDLIVADLEKRGIVYHGKYD